MTGMAADLHKYLQQSREGLLGALDGLSEYDVRRPMVPSGTNLLGLDAPASVSWWPEERRQTTLGHLLARMVDETARHAGHADIFRELIDGRGGRDHDDAGDEGWWEKHLARVQRDADAFR